MDFDAIVLAGGRATRLNGIDKAELEIAGKRLIDRVMDSVSGARRVVAVGPARHTIRGAAWTRESPPGGGPVSAIAAGLLLCEAPTVFVSAVDLPWLDVAVVERVLAMLGSECDGVIAIDDQGRDQPLLGAYKTQALTQALERIGYRSGASMNALIAQMDLLRVPEPEAARDCDTWEDVARATEEVG